MRKQILSFLMAVMMIFTIIPSLGLEIAAANAPAKLTNPSITPIEQSANKYVGYYDDEVSNSSKLTVKWRDVGQEYFNVAVKLLNGEPLTSSNEDGKYFYSLIREYQSNSITISASQMKEAAGKWVKVYIQSHFADGTETECHYYFKVSGAKFSRKPTLSLSVSGNELDTGVYGMYNPGETVYFNCTANYSDHIFVQTSSDDLYFTNPEGYVGKSGTFIEESSASASSNRSYENGEKMQIYINIAEDAEPGDYTITVTATDGVYDPDTFSSIPGTSYYSSVKKSVTVRVEKKGYNEERQGNVDLTDERFQNMGAEYKYSKYYKNLQDVVLTGDYADDIVAVALSQLGYVEASNGQSVYGLFYGNNNTGNDASWCAHFTNWCAGRAQIPSDIIGLSWTANPGHLVPNGEIGLVVDKDVFDNHIENWKAQKTNGKLSFSWLSDDRVVRVDKKSYIPQKGDLVFWGNTDSRLTFTHVGIITDDSNGVTYSYIDGNGGANQADNVSLQRNCKISEMSIIAYARPNYSTENNGWKNPFTDISTTDYYYDAVRYLYENGITAGTSATTFSPESTCTRAEVVTFLWRAAGCPEPKSVRNPFKDVKSSDWFFKPVLWAVEQNITQGTSATTFTPVRKCSTAEILTFLFRSVGAGTNGYYQEAADWAEGRGLLKNTGLKVNPETPCPRKAIAMYLYRIEQ